MYIYGVDIAVMLMHELAYYLCDTGVRVGSSLTANAPVQYRT